MTKTMSITKAREQLTTLVEKADKKLEEFVITVNGTPSAVIISAAEYESWKETNEILSNRGLMRDIKKAEKDFTEGKGMEWEDVKKSLRLNVQD